MGYKTVKPRHEKQKEIQNKKIYNDIKTEEKKRKQERISYLEVIADHMQIAKTFLFPICCIRKGNPNRFWILGWTRHFLAIGWSVLYDIKTEEKKRKQERISYLEVIADHMLLPPDVMAGVPLITMNGRSILCGIPAYR